ncbi:MAG: undecaprenyldiphospho-muramoylpentapeptide beta-N-acetylglucosaminyltransferase [Bryobacterales bacterium]|jgi:UDP-N-acetylglucosamine--N-acetylmuramyl-(pentapeptide) pyrophosphoryl-undecaprenol N-acetylglucosamine transferase|nr:undecaprenyldiphospho-muramoylpentapeptide beta-N-acetylglucosaminyltransferase [Bryobacterales bacterium]
MNYRILITGGGTGGHVIPALAVAQELRGRGHDILFVGVESGMEARLAPEAGFPIRFVRAQGLNRVGLVNAMRSLSLLPGSVFQAAREIRDFQPHVLFSMGGYVAGPVMAAGRLTGTPMVIMEPNAYPGLTARWTSKVVRRALVNFPETLAFFPPGRAQVTGVPVREAFFHLPVLDPRPPFTLLVTGGSQGSRALNSALREAWPVWKRSGVPLRILHQAGRLEVDAVGRDFAHSGLDGEVFAFHPDMPALFGQAHLVVGRSGASAVAELCAAGRPSILVPFPAAADNHQLKNAQALASVGAARLLQQHQLSGGQLAEDVLALFQQPEALTTMAQRAQSLAQPGAASRVADILQQEAARP